MTFFRETNNSCDEKWIEAVDEAPIRLGFALFFRFILRMGSVWPEAK